MSAAEQSGEVQRLESASTPRLWDLEPREAAMLAGILVATALAYLPSLPNGWVFDDTSQIVGSVPLHSWSGIGKSFIYDSWWFRNPNQLPQSAYYRPLQASWFGLNYMILGNHPAAWHIEKILLELIAVILSFRLSQLLTRSSTIALLTAAIFGLIPANVESVAWASAIGEPLATISEMAALCCLINRRPGWSRGLMLALMLYAAALLSHESAILFPLIVATYVLLFEAGDDRAAGAGRTAGTGLPIASALRVCAPFVALAIAYMCVRVCVLGSDYMFGVHQSGTGPMIARGFVELKRHYSLAAFFMTLPVALITYLAVLTLPAMAGPTHAVQWITHPQPFVFISAVALVLIAAAVLVPAWRSSNRRIYLFCAAWSLLAIAPALNLNALEWLVDDRYLYAPSFGWSLAVAVTACGIAAARPRARSAVVTAMAALLALYAVSTIQIEHYWHDELTLFQRCVEISPTNPDYRLRLVGALNKARDFEGAARQLERVSALQPERAYFHLRLAQQYQMMGRELDSEREFQKFNELSEAMIQRQRAAQRPSASQPPPDP